MNNETTATLLTHEDLKIANSLIYKTCGFDLQNLQINPESKKYHACSFTLNDYKVQYRVAKITPTKVGQFVTTWKRNQDGTTVPFDVSDDIDFMIISTRNGDNFGQFIFPKQTLASNLIISQNGKEGKRGIRVYPPWDVAVNKQAQKTQAWQLNYFVKIAAKIDLEKAKALFQAHPF